MDRFLAHPEHVTLVLSWQPVTVLPWLFCAHSAHRGGSPHQAVCVADRLLVATALCAIAVLDLPDAPVLSRASPGVTRAAFPLR